MEHPIAFWIVIIIFCSMIGYLVKNMIKDKNWLIRFLGYAIAVVIVVAMLGLILDSFFGIDLHQVLPIFKA